MDSAHATHVHRHGRRVHGHTFTRPHRHLSAPRLSQPLGAVSALPPEQRRSRGGDHHEHHHHHDDGAAHGHSHGLIHEDIRRSRAGIRAVSLSLGVLGITAALQTIVFVASGSIALLADLIHNFGDAMTALPLGVAFALRSRVAERRAGLVVVAAIFISACLAGVEAVSRLLHPSAPTHLVMLAVAGLIGFLGNYVAGLVRSTAGRRLKSPALIADGNHARADAYVSLAVIASAAVVAIGLPIADPLIGLAITLVIMRITWESWRTVRRHEPR